MTIFYIISIITILLALYMVLTDNTFRSILAFLGTVIGVAGIYFFSHAEFLAVVQILIYGGAIVTITIFILMLTPEIEKTELKLSTKKIFAGISSLLFLGILIFTLTGLKNKIEFKSFTIKEIGTKLLTTYAVPFEIISILLLSTLIGAIIIARKN